MTGTTHLTRNKHLVTHLDTWGHGKAPSGDWHSRPATIVMDDGDGHFDAFSYDGPIMEAAEEIAHFMPSKSEPHAIILEGSTLRFASEDEWPEGFETVAYDEDGEACDWEYDFSKYPQALGFSS